MWVSREDVSGMFTTLVVKDASRANWSLRVCVCCVCVCVCVCVRVCMYVCAKMGE